MLKRLAIPLLALVAFRAYGQGPDFGGPVPTNEDLETQEGLEGATPTDNVNELGNSAGLNGADAPVEDFPAQENSGNFDIDDTQGTGNDALFDDAPVDFGNGKGNNTGSNFNSAFGNNAPLKNNTVPANNAPKNNGAPAANLPVNNAPVNNLPVNAVPLNNGTTPVLNATPLQSNAPANAEALLNQISNEAPANVQAVPAQAVTTEATGMEPLTTKVEVPVISAPPLPPPNDFSGAPPVPGTMRLMAEGEAPEEYKVEPGDTLFDICDQMLDEAAYWPKLWSLNPEIKNPHFIFPNMRLKFYPGDDETPPYLQVVSEDDVIPIDKGDLDEQELIAEKVIFPTEEVAEGEITEVIGPSQVDEVLTDSFLTSGRLYEGSEVAVQVPGFIFADEREAAGYVIGGRSGELSLAETQKAIVEASSGLAPGTLYTVLRRGEEIASPDTGDFVGYKYYFVSNMRVDRGVEDGIYVGTVENSRLSVRPNDVLVSFISTNRSVPIGSGVGQIASVSANVVGFEYAGQEVGGAGGFAFLDKGNGDGVAPGMYVSVYQTPGFLQTSFGAPDLPVDYEYVGVLRIIDTTDAGAVGYVVRNVKEIRVGDRTTGKG